MEVNNKVVGCQCFTCANKDNKVAVKSYLLGQFEAYREVAKQLKECGVNLAPLSEKTTLGSLLTECMYNVDASATLLSELTDVKLNGSLAEEFNQQEEITP